MLIQTGNGLRTFPLKRGIYRVYFEVVSCKTFWVETTHSTYTRVVLFEMTYMSIHYASKKQKCWNKISRLFSLSLCVFCDIFTFLVCITQLRFSKNTIT